MHAAREREQTTEPFPPAPRTGKRRAAGRRGVASLRRSDRGCPPSSPMPSALPFVHLTAAGQSISWPRDGRHSGMPGLRPTGLPYFALPVPPRPSSHADRRSISKVTIGSHAALCSTQKTSVATVEKSVAPFLETCRPPVPPTCSPVHLFGTNRTPRPFTDWSAWIFAERN